jgi:tight adherence protein C
MTLQLFVTLVTVFVAVAATVSAVAWWWLESTTPEQRRLRTLVRVTSGVVASRSLVAENHDPALSRLTRLIPKSPKDMSRLQRRLTRAGYPNFRSVVIYALAEMLLPIAVGVPVLIGLGIRMGLIPALMLAAIGFALPGLWVGHKRSVRQKAIRNGLPDALDLLTVSVEAGCGLDQAIGKANEELRIAHPILADELRLITTEIRAGKPRLEAFKNFAQRTGVEDVRSLVSMLTQTDRFGTSIGQALRVHAEASRTKRRQLAEERAGKVGVKLVFPLVFLLFPAFFVVTLGPSVIMFVRVFFGQIMGQQ